MAAVAVDTNLMLLLIVGRTRRDFISKHKRLKAYTESDFDLVARLVGDVDVVLTTPNVLTEVNNLLVQGVLEPLRSQLLAMFSLLVTATAEKYHPSCSSIGDDSFVALGLTDATWLCVLDADSVLITDDRDLTWHAQARGISVLNIDALRANLSE
jgi:hypothetical protein